MKKIYFIGLFFMIFVLICPGQGIYSKKNLGKASQKDLTLYLEKAQKLKKTGAIMSIAGPVSSVAGITIAALAYSGGTSGEFAAGYLMFLGGIVTTAIGLPILVTGSTRVKMVKNAKNTLDGARLYLAPSILFSYKTQNIQPGVTLKLRF